jgi:hypothetical protein
MRELARQVWLGAGAPAAELDRLPIEDSGDVLPSDQPVPLPAQALDHATGYLLAFGVVDALRRRLADGGSWAIAVSLARTAAWLDGVGRTEPAAVPEGAANLVAFTGPLGHTRHVPCPGEIAGYRPRWTTPPRPLGYDRPEWL